MWEVQIEKSTNENTISKLQPTITAIVFMIQLPRVTKQSAMSSFLFVFDNLISPFREH